jgi:hypothetical protein
MKTVATTVPAAVAEHTLVLADWKADPQEVIAACAGRPEVHDAAVDLVVPATLHGIDWVGDPYANAPCARRVLDELIELFVAAGIEVASGTVGAPDPVAAAIDAVLSQPVERIIVCGLKRRISAIGPGARIGRSMALPVLAVPVPPTRQTRHGWQRLQRGECTLPTRARKPLAA